MSQTQESSYVVWKYVNCRKVLVIASVLTIMMAVPHFFIPFLFPWERLTGELYPPVRWALFAMNFFISLLLFWGGLLSLVTALKWNATRAMRYWILGGMGMFWLVGAIYEMAIPFPMAEAKSVLLAIALAIACLYAVAILFMRKRYSK